MPVLRQLTSCQAPATITVTHRTSRSTLAWQVSVCHRHRWVAMRLTGASSLNHKATRRIAGNSEAPRCGTMHDHQPIDRALQTHARMWLQAPAEPGDTWPVQLRNAADHAATVGAPGASTITKAAQLGGTGPDDPAVQTRVLELLSRAESSSPAVAARR
ncbi:hypothetical protein [Streptomyces tagetis]|uniref:Uncharacterized protein n=1 Tax=Streptomyces tagetis TaxID=2820809 RepID=A0A941B173_9ACTN|nr:hypothetical protein [Streptomyces sp. RG38]MBQ0827681.1 hypothetical protein [Streptomyces sp. RG38]